MDDSNRHNRIKELAVMLMRERLHWVIPMGFPDSERVIDKVRDLSVTGTAFTVLTWTEEIANNQLVGMIFFPKLLYPERSVREALKDLCLFEDLPSDQRDLIISRDVGERMKEVMVEMLQGRPGDN